MHIPPYHKKRVWQFFLLGTFLGTIIGYMILLFMHAKMYEHLLTEHIELQTEARELKRNNELLLLDKEKLQKTATITVQSIEVHLLNSESFRFDRLMIHQLNDYIKEELSDIIGKEVTDVGENSELFMSIVEKSQFTIDEFTYTFEVEKIVIAEIIQLYLVVKFAP